MTSPILAAVPRWLVQLRLGLGPALLVGALLHVPRVWLAAGLTVAFLSDVFDGIIARRIGVSTPELRIADSRADVILYLCVLIGVWFLQPEPLWALRGPFLILVLLQLASWRMDRIKFGRATALHSYTAKAWGITLFLAVFAILAGLDARPYLQWALWVGYVSNLEDIAIKAVLPSWHCDVGSVWHAWKIRQKEGMPAS
jgi:CDP-diacylglycerol--glycerol-3-phosphate 3-phosphatidyltransferase